MRKLQFAARVCGYFDRAPRTSSRSAGLFWWCLLLWFLPPNAPAQWLDITNLSVRLNTNEQAGLNLVLDYDLNETNGVPESPAYVFIRYSADAGKNWRLLPMKFLRGNGHDIVEKPGRKQSIWWGVGKLGLTNLSTLQFRVHGLPMVRVPEGRFIMKAIPGAGHDASRGQVDEMVLPTFYLAKNETTLAMYADYLNETGKEAAGWVEKMASKTRCGIERGDGDAYRVVPGREKYPINYVSWYDAVAFLEWCGLRLPTEAEWMKAVRGGLYLDGDETKLQPNPLPERRFPWSDDEPDAGGIYRCNLTGEEDGFQSTAPVGSFAKFNSPYGACDLAGNLAEWTLDWYATPYHAGMDGFRIVHGGSWMDLPVACDAVTAPTSLPLKESSIMGFRGVR